jgi:hypothetical protein
MMANVPTADSSSGVDDSPPSGGEDNAESSSSSPPSLLRNPTVPAAKRIRYDPSVENGDVRGPA